MTEQKKKKQMITEPLHYADVEPEFPTDPKETGINIRERTSERGRTLLND